MAEYSREQLEEALVKTYQAGDMDASRILADKLASIRGLTLQKEQPYSGSILPFSRDETGKISFDPNAGILGPFTRGMKATGDILAGKLSPVSPEAYGAARELAAVASPMSPAARIPGSVFYAPATDKLVPKEAPTREALDAAKTALYEKVKNLDVRYNPNSVTNFSRNVIGKLNEDGFISELAPEVHSLLGKIANAPEGSYVKMQSLDALRKRLGDIAGDPNRTKASAATEAIKALDSFIETAGPKDIVSRAPSPASGAISVPGQDFSAADAAIAKQASDLIKEARGNAAAGFRSDKVTGIQDLIDLRTAAANSGRNLDNTTRQRLVSLLTDKEAVRGFSAEELSAMRDIIMGSPTKNSLRIVGNLFGGGGGLGQTVLSAVSGGAGAAAGGIPGAIAGAAVPGILGTAARTGANTMSKKELQALDEMIRLRSPLGEKIPQQTEYSPQALLGLLAKSLGLGTAKGGLLGPTEKEIQNERNAAFIRAGGV